MEAERGREAQRYRLVERGGGYGEGEIGGVMKRVGGCRGEEERW